MEGLKEGLRSRIIRFELVIEFIPQGGDRLMKIFHFVTKNVERGIDGRMNNKQLIKG